MAKNNAFRPDDVWDGWAPSEEMIKRAESSRPFWSYWDKDRVNSVQELFDAFTMRGSASMVRSFDPSRSPHRAAPFMSQAEEDVYGRFIEWLKDIHDAGMKRYLPMVQGVIVLEERCPDQALFERLVGYHVKIRLREMQRYVAQRHRR